MADFDKVIPPGQEGKIKLVVDGKKVNGAFHKTAQVHSNDPENSIVTLAVNGEEVPYVSVAPTPRVYLQGEYDQPVSQTVTVSSNEKDLDFKVEGLSSNIDDKITYKVEPGAEAGSYQVHIYKNPKLPTLNTFGTLYIHTNSKKAPETQVQVQVVTRGSITIQPTLINFGAVRFGMGGKEAQPVTRNVTLLKSKGEFKIKDIKFNSDRYEAKVQEMIPGQRYEVDVKFHPPKKTMPRQREVGEMIIHTNDPHEPTIRVKLVARAM